MFLNLDDDTSEDAVPVARSGVLPSDQRVRWRGDSALEDRGAQGESLAGGYYDAGNMQCLSNTLKDNSVRFH